MRATEILKLPPSNLENAFQTRIFGLEVTSNRIIPGARSVPKAGGVKSPDLDVLFGATPLWASGEQKLRYQHTATDAYGTPMFRCQDFGSGRFLLCYADDTRFHLDLGNSSLCVTWVEPFTLEDATTYLLGPVLGFFLRCRGKVCLHASAVAMDGRCIAFLGPAGAGKSTLAAAFAGDGDEVLTEDVACLDPRDGKFFVQPGYPLIRLWENSAMLLGTANSLPLLTPTWDKRYLPLDDGCHRFHSDPAELGAVFLLTARRPMEGPAEISRLSGRATLTELVANTYTNYLLDRQMREHEFELLGELVRKVPVYALSLNQDGSRLFEACDWIKRHAFAPRLA